MIIKLNRLTRGNLLVSYFGGLFFLFLSSVLFAATKIHNYNNPSDDEIITSEQAAKNKIVNLEDLINAVRENDTSKTKEIISLGINPNGVDAEGATALIVASLRGLDAMVKVLLANDADPTIKDEQNLSAIDIAKHKGGHQECVKLMEQYIVKKEL